MSKNESEWLGGAQLAAMLGVSSMTIWRWERDPDLKFPPPAIIRDRKYWSRAAVNKWMRDTAVNTARRTREPAA